MYRSMRHVTKNVMITLTIDVILILLMGIRNVTCVHLALAPKESHNSQLSYYDMSFD